MSAAKVELIGMAQFRAALRQLPEELSAEAGAIVEAHTIEAARQVQAGYPQGPTGNLRRGVTSKVEHSRFGGSGEVKSRAKHASIFERGTVRRQTRTGANRGSMPKPPVEQRFIPKVIRLRSRMTRQLIALVERAGFVVSES